MAVLYFISIFLVYSGVQLFVLASSFGAEPMRLNLEQAIQAAQKADAIIYGFHYVDRGFYAQNGMMFGGGGDSALSQQPGD